MLYPSIDDLKKRADSRYTLVMIASKRSRDLIDGYPALVDIDNEKPVSIATEEIARGMVSYTRRFPLDESSEDEEIAAEDASFETVSFEETAEERPGDQDLPESDDYYAAGEWTEASEEITEYGEE